jgi:hypothetical protein
VRKIRVVKNRDSLSTNVDSLQRLPVESVPRMLYNGFVRDPTGAAETPNQNVNRLNRFGDQFGLGERAENETHYNLRSRGFLSEKFMFGLRTFAADIISP